jgi:N-acetyl-1-D-myo-inositol-2-amino-2-deoxy-alpha-D-glucopyranoside deacetylase
VTAEIDVREVLEAKIAALRAHATQLTVAPDERSFALTNGVAQPVLPAEHYVLAGGTSMLAGGPLAGASHPARERDLLAGLAVPSE